MRMVAMKAAIATFSIYVPLEKISLLALGSRVKL